MYFCGYFVLSTCPNWEDFSLTSIFGFILGQNMGVGPMGCPFIGFPTTDMQLILKK